MRILMSWRQLDGIFKDILLVTEELLIKLEIALIKMPWKVITNIISEIGQMGMIKKNILTSYYCFNLELFILTQFRLKMGT